MLEGTNAPTGLVTFGSNRVDEPATNRSRPRGGETKLRPLSLDLAKAIVLYQQSLRVAGDAPQAAE